LFVSLFVLACLVLVFVFRKGFTRYFMAILAPLHAKDVHR
jgi:hypothetical protein